jgi:hypothetical protein
MAKSSGANDAAKEGPLELAGMLLVILVVMVFLVWLFGSTRIVMALTPTLRAVGSMWLWLPAEAGAQQALEVYRSARVFLQAPAEVNFFAYVSFVNLAITPLVLCVWLGFVAWFCVAIAAPRQPVFRRFSRAEDLMQGISHVFTGIAPILHIRQDLAQHKDPLWARQRFPEEVLFGEHVGGTPLVGRMKQSPEVHVINLDAVERWFKGLEPSPGWTPTPVPGHPTLRRSRTLGHQVVDLANPADRAMFRSGPLWPPSSPSSPPRSDGVADAGSPSFVDRFSDVGQVMFGLLCAHAYGGKDGVADFQRARDELNNSCRGAKHGLPKLAVAQWIVDKYRHNDLARKLFAVHHWEYTYLLELFIQAKRRGKVPDSEFRWLKPASRTLWYVLNTAGRFTPHTDSAAAFNQHAFERKCARRKHWPLRINGLTNRFEPSIHVKEAVQGLKLEFDRWISGSDENDDEWWKDRHEWVTSNRFVIQDAAAPSVPAQSAAAQQMEQTSFDREQTQARTLAQQASNQASQRELAALMDALGPNGDALVL